MSFDLEKVGNDILAQIKRQQWFPYRTGNLKFNATEGVLINKNTYRISFDTEIAPYIVALEEGSQPHNIPNAFGKGMNFGTSGNFNGKFHSGSMKHKGFISQKCTHFIAEYLNTLGKGRMEYK